MSAQHIPNWFIDQYGHVYAMRPPVDGVSTSECLVDSRYSKATVQEKLLIAAAPELLEALQPFGSINLVESRLPAEFAMLVLRARSAIAKATGGQQ